MLIYETSKNTHTINKKCVNFPSAVLISVATHNLQTADNVQVAIYGTDNLNRRLLLDDVRYFTMDCKKMWFYSVGF